MRSTKPPPSISVSDCQRSIEKSELILHIMETFSTHQITIGKKDIERRVLYGYRQGWVKLKLNLKFLVPNFESDTVGGRKA